MRDIVVLMEDVDLEKVLFHLERGKRELLKEQVCKIIECSMILN